jgi:23S rRNA (uracil1939-C5)-methyltransferase
MSKKNKIAEICIEKMIFPNKGIGYYEGCKVVIKNTFIGQKVLANIAKRNGSYKGRVIELIEKSDLEITPSCSDFGVCGGCTYQNISYETEINLKEEMVLEILKEAGINDYLYEGIEKAPISTGYRNKMEYSFGDEQIGGVLALGMRKRNSYYEVVTSKKCDLVDEDYRKLLHAVLEFFKTTEEKFYHKATHIGSLRHLVIRKGYFTKEIIINLITSSQLNTELQQLANILENTDLDGDIVGIYHTVNDSLSDVVKCDNMEILHGKDFFMERLLGLDFKITPFSFFQTNSTGAEKLYETVRDFVGEAEGLNIFDLYCGTGTIAQIISKNAKQVIGVEIISEAIEAAIANTNLNKISNCKFISGDVLKVVDELDVTPDIIVLDPPREGIHPKAILKIISFGADKIVYVSCKPTSLSRDLVILKENGYEIERIKIHDMFPRTGNVETVALLKLIK